MYPIQLKAHERPLTWVRYNADGDLIFTCSKDQRDGCMVWYVENGERLGTYRGHTGAIWMCDVDYSSTRLITGAADNTWRMWDVQTGNELFVVNEETPVRSVQFDEGCNRVVILTDRIMGHKGAVKVYNVKDGKPSEPELVIPLGNRVKATMAVFAPLNKQIFTSHDDGSISVWDPVEGKLLGQVKDHEDGIFGMKYSWDKLELITFSKDCTAKLYDASSLECLKTYVTERPVNAAAVSPAHERVILGGGQEAGEVTTTSTRVGKFQTRFFHKIYEDEIGSVKGHFGPINTLDFSPDGKSFVSGAEDGFVRLHHFDKDYFETKLE
eukprot:GCRY01001464.1.p1 GENE.GCRY01001464.1~~GCRY01001464.1.p1  ORF type:complete len:325 (-),score=46.88 GCRY01001464.1:70-1044(-)